MVPVRRGMCQYRKAMLEVTSAYQPEYLGGSQGIDDAATESAGWDADSTEGGGVDTGRYVEDNVARIIAGS